MQERICYASGRFSTAAAAAAIARIAGGFKAILSLVLASKISLALLAAFKTHTSFIMKGEGRRTETERPRLGRWVEKRVGVSSVAMRRRWLDVLYQDAGSANGKIAPLFVSRILEASVNGHSWITRPDHAPLPTAKC